MKQQKKKESQFASTRILVIAMALTSCQTAETGGKVVDRGRGEIVLSSSSDQRSALPLGSQDSSLTSAREKLDTSVKENPKDLAALLSLAQLQLAQDKFKDADETCQKILRLDIRNQEAKKVLAQAAIRLDNPDRALIFLTALGGPSSRDSSVLNMLGLVAVSRQDNTLAMQYWKQALTLNANDISARMNLGVMYLKYRLVGQAATQFERILKVAPNHQDAKLHMAIIDGSRNNHEQSIAVYRSILSLDKDNPLALYNLAVSLNATNQLEDAADSIKRYIRVSPKKSSQTDQAFALLDEINVKKQSQGHRVSDDEIRELAQSLERKKSNDTVAKETPKKHKESPAAPKVVETKPQAPSEAKPVVSETKPKSSKSLGADQNIEDLEKELRAH